MRGVALVLLLFLAPLAAGAPTAPEGEPVSCGSVSPLANACDAGAVRMGREPEAEIAVFAFVGRVTVEARQEVPEPPFYGVYRWRCDVLGAAPLVECATSTEGRPIPGLTARVTCTASPHPSTPLLPPVGGWGCVLDPGTPEP